MQSQLQLFYQAQRKIADGNLLFLDMVHDGLTREELARLIERRPGLWDRYSTWLTVLPAETSNLPEPAAEIMPKTAITGGWLGTAADLAVFKAATLTWGEEAQRKVAIGECGEYLTLHGREVQGRASAEAWIDEIADVSIMMAQMAALAGREQVQARIQQKIEGLRVRLGMVPEPQTAVEPEARVRSAC